MKLKLLVIAVVGGSYDSNKPAANAISTTINSYNKKSDNVKLVEDDVSITLLPLKPSQNSQTLRREIDKVCKLVDITEYDAIHYYFDDANVVKNNKSQWREIFNWGFYLQCKNSIVPYISTSSDVSLRLSRFYGEVILDIPSREYFTFKNNLSLARDVSI